MFIEKQAWQSDVGSGSTIDMKFRITGKSVKCMNFWTFFTQKNSFEPSNIFKYFHNVIARPNCINHWPCSQCCDASLSNYIQSLSNCWITQTDTCKQLFTSTEKFENNCNVTEIVY